VTYDLILMYELLIPDCDISSVQDVYLEVVMYRLRCLGYDCPDFESNNKT
jgi:hypothetical protein